MSIILPYTDRKLERMEDLPLDIDTIVSIQQMDCAGKTRDEIYDALADQGIGMEQISRVLDSAPERGVNPRQQRANVGFAAQKTRFR